LRLYSEYIKEREGFETFVYEDIAFTTYKKTAEFLEIGDVYVMPEHRGSFTWKRMMDRITCIGKGMGCKKLAARVMINTNNPTLSLRSTLAYDFKVVKADNDMIYLLKEI
jgi:GNAT superfamily N-acetyltransferase